MEGAVAFLNVGVMAFQAVLAQELLDDLGRGIGGGGQGGGGKGEAKQSSRAVKRARGLQRGMRHRTGET